MRDAIKGAGRASFHLLGGAAIALLCCLGVGLALFTAVLAVTVIGAGVLPETVLLLRRLAGWERRRTAALTGTPVPEAYLPLEGPLPARVRTAVTDPGTARDLIWAAGQLLYGLVLWWVSLLLWVPALLVDGVVAGLAGRRPVALPLIGALAGLEAEWSRALLTPTPAAARDAALAARVEQLTATRAGAIAAHGAELRRIERDLHDGAQARLVALSMRIGLARRVYDSDPAAARKLLDDAQTQAEEALAELRHVVRGIHPPILTDRGLTGAVRALAASSGLEVAVSVTGLADSPAVHPEQPPAGDGERPSADLRPTTEPPAPTADAPRAPAAVEAAAYFVVAEALTNAAKHSGATRASVALTRAPAALRVRVADEGRGGAEAGERGGSGLVGMRRRVAALDGTVRLTSPEGGPTVIEVELPCVW
ncbi:MULTISPECIES: sensor histidine kinase [Streptomyces]|uniref:histidine kinase n=4 Tax=Streptomyces venezuelae TaxID=54571 RepID=F2RAA8_STRVP|nr:histidine kinase [Streptomyces venezuelae]APE22411.1 sensor histidine kinase [Streptomyces venezuelae]QER99795.1 sensor histidine kinase [Streptomyces venezuelae ATCC 10712]CCA56590.1 two-component system sensor kinase [Streptomyces venezuelae ATCC 10712]